MSLFLKWLQQLSENDLTRLLHYASKHHGWLERYGGPSPADLVNEAFLRHIDGRRKAPPDSEFDKRLVWVCRTIDSIASHAWEAWQNQPLLRDPDDPADEEKTDALNASESAVTGGGMDSNREDGPLRRFGMQTLATPSDRPRHESTSCPQSAVDFDSPEHIAIGLDLEHRLRSVLSDRPRHVRVLELKLKGYSHTEVAHELGLCNARVTQLIEEIRNLVLDFYQHNT